MRILSKNIYTRLAYKYSEVDEPKKTIDFDRDACWYIISWPILDPPSNLVPAGFITIKRSNQTMMNVLNFDYRHAHHLYIILESLSLVESVANRFNRVWLYIHDDSCNRADGCTSETFEMLLGSSSTSESGNNISDPTTTIAKLLRLASPTVQSNWIIGPYLPSNQTASNIQRIVYSIQDYLSNPINFDYRFRWYQDGSLFID